MRSTAPVYNYNKFYLVDAVNCIRIQGLEELNSRNIMFQLIVAMDCGVLAVEFANLYIIETTLKGVQMRHFNDLEWGGMCYIASGPVWIKKVWKLCDFNHDYPSGVYNGSYYKARNDSSSRPINSPLAP